MEYCHYHPVSAATFYCAHCFSFHCDRCVDEGEKGLDEKCFACQHKMEHLGAVNTVTPYWRRLQESFRYPLQAQCLVFLVVISVMGSLVTYVPLGPLWLLILNGMFIKYCFVCLQDTAQGLLVPPDISVAYSGGLSVIIGLFAIIFIVSALFIGSLEYLGPAFSGLLGFLLIMCVPAIIILYGMTDSFLESLNPLSIFKLIAGIGLPYGLILAFIMIMFASVGLISELIGYDFSFLSTTLQGLVGNYYLLVLFHIMGYMVFQYQGSFGFVARENDGSGQQVRHYRDRLASKLDIALKNGDYEHVVSLFEQALKQFPQDKDFNKHYFEFMLATRRTEAIEKAATCYLLFLLGSQQDHLLSSSYKRVRQLSPNYLPDSARLRHQLARVCYERGDLLAAVKLINGMHKTFPDYPALGAAYDVMADALEELPDKKPHALKCRALANKLKSMQSEPQPEQEPEPELDSTDKNSTEAHPDIPSEDTQPEGDLPPIEFK